MGVIRVAVYGKRECALCDEVKATLLAVRTEIPFVLDEVDIEWKDSKLDKATIYSKLGGKCRVRSAAPIKLISERAGHEAKTIEPTVIEFETKAGGTYSVSSEN